MISYLRTMWKIIWMSRAMKKAQYTLNRPCNYAIPRIGYRDMEYKCGRVFMIHLKFVKEPNVVELMHAINAEGSCYKGMGLEGVWCIQQSKFLTWLMDTLETYAVKEIVKTKNIGEEDLIVWFRIDKQYVPTVSYELAGA